MSQGASDSIMHDDSRPGAACCSLYRVLASGELEVAHLAGKVDFRALQDAC